MPASSFQQQKLRVCEVCSAYLGLHDNDRRLADHFGGKLHLGFIQIREKLDQLRVMLIYFVSAELLGVWLLLALILKSYLYSLSWIWTCFCVVCFFLFCCLFGCEKQVWRRGPSWLLPRPSMRSEAVCVGCLPGWTVPRDWDLSAYL